MWKWFHSRAMCGGESKDNGAGQPMRRTPPLMNHLAVRTVIALRSRSLMFFSYGVPGLTAGRLPFRTGWRGLMPPEHGVATLTAAQHAECGQIVHRVWSYTGLAIIAAGAVFLGRAAGQSRRAADQMERTRPGERSVTSRVQCIA